MPSERKRDGETPASDFGLLRSYLARQGVSQAAIKTVIGTGAQGRSRAGITDVLHAWMRELPKAQTVRGTLADAGMRAAIGVVGRKVTKTARKATAEVGFRLDRVVMRVSRAVDRATDAVVARLV